MRDIEGEWIVQWHSVYNIERSNDSLSHSEAHIVLLRTNDIFTGRGLVVTTPTDVLLSSPVLTTKWDPSVTFYLGAIDLV